MTTHLLGVAGLSVGYLESTVVHDVSITIGAGEAVCLLGPNGAGKTTLLRGLSGVAPHASGSVTLDGHELSRVRANRRVRLGLVHVPEGRHTVMPTLTVEENLALAGRRGAGIADIADLFPMLADRRRQRAGTLSGGQQQMLAIALGLVLRPKVLLVDEPSAGLAPSLVDEVFTHLKELGSRGTALLLAEQRVDLALEVADRGYVLEHGQVVAAGSSAELRASVELSRSYLGG